MFRIKWRREMEERRKQAKVKEKEMAKLRAQAVQCSKYIFHILHFMSEKQGVASPKGVQGQ